MFGKKERTLLFANNLWYLSEGMLGPLFGIFCQRFNSSPLDISWVWSLYLISVGIVVIGLGYISDFIHKETGTECEEYTDADLCKAIFLLQLLYRGTLLVGWAPSEFSKDPYVEPKVASHDKADADIDADTKSEEENEEEQPRNSVSV